MEKFVNFWANIWEDESPTPQRKWMDKIKQKMIERVYHVDQLSINEEDLGNIIKKRKNWSAPGIDAIPNYWWKVLPSTWRKLAEIMQGWIEDPDRLPAWLTLGRTVLIPKSTDLSSEKDYRPITCLNTSYKIFTGLLAKHVKQHVVENDLWIRAKWEHVRKC